MESKKGFGGTLFDLCNYTFLLAFAFLCLFPFVQIIGGSFATTEELLLRNIVIIPKNPTLEAYRFIFSDITIPRAMLVSIGVAVVGTFINLLLTSTTAYALSRPGLKGRRLMMLAIVFTILFQGGLIPTYLVVKELNMLNTFWAIMIPNAISAFNLILMRNFFMALPEELFDSAKIDGSSDIGTFIKIVLPLSKAALATFTLFYAVSHWNNFMAPFLYLDKPWMWPIQIWLRNIIILATYDFADAGIAVEVPSRSLRMATIVIATVPILLVYPFIQKYFTKGVMLGSVKG